MDKRGNFEEKIKAKLEGVSESDADQAWLNFAPLLHPPSIPFWKHWFMPYLFAGLLFLASLGWHQFVERGTDNLAESRPDPMLASPDTVYHRDTIYVIDTVVVYKKIYVEERQTLSSRLQNGIPLDSVSSERSVDRGERSSEFSQDLTKAEKKSFADVEIKQNGSIEENKLPVENLRPIALDRTVRDLNQLDTGALSTSRSEVALETSPSTSEPTQVRRSMAAPSIGAKPTVVFKSEKELVVGDTSNLSNPPLNQKAKPMLHLELGMSLFFPISRYAEYYKPFQQGIQFGVEWESGWGVYLGAIRNQMEGELDDEEIMMLDSDLYGSLPNVPANSETLDEIYFTNRQWFFPMELRWRSLYYSGFSFESSLGLMGNYIVRQDFAYEFENNSDQEYQYGSTTSGEFGFSHLRMGIGTNYLLSRKMGLFLRSHYWLPVSRPGLIQDRVHGLEVGVGVNFYLGK